MRPSAGPRGWIAAASVAALFVVIGAVPRLLNAAGTVPDILRPFTWSDAWFTWERGLSGGRIPYWDSYFEYPPLLGYLSGALSVLTRSAVAYVAAWLVLQVAAAVVIAVILTREAGSARTLRRWSLAPQLLTFGSLNFDLLPTAAVVAAVALARRRRELRGAAALGVGAVLKIFPAFALPVLLLRDIRRPVRAATMVAIFGAVVILAYLPSAFAPFSSLESVFRYSGKIEANPDSVWRIVHEVIAQIDPQNAAALVVLITSIGLVLTYVALVLPRALRDADVARAMGLAVIVVLLWSRLYSPQFSLWWLPFATLLPISARTFAWLIAGDMIVWLSISALTLVIRVPGDPLGDVALGTLIAGAVIRHVGLIRAAGDIVSVPDTSLTSAMNR